jgi:hypothetical protein
MPSTSWWWGTLQFTGSTSVVKSWPMDVSLKQSPVRNSYHSRWVGGRVVGGWGPG